MGHYAGEMECPTCRECRCTCRPPKDTSLEKFYIDNDYLVKRGNEIYYVVNGAKYQSSLYGKNPYNSEEEALAAVPKKISKDIKQNQLQILKLEKLLAKVEKQLDKLGIKYEI